MYVVLLKHGLMTVFPTPLSVQTITLADHIKILGVTLDKNLSMNNHVSAVCKSIHYHIRALRHIRSSISEDMAKMVACALVGSRLDYANSVLFGATQKNISKTPKGPEPPRPCCYLFSSILQSRYSPPAAPLAPD